MAQILLDGFVLPPPFFEAQLIDYSADNVLDVCLKSLHDNVLTFPFEELIIPVAVKDLLVVFA